MNEATASLSEFGAVPEGHIRFSSRLLIYVGIWLLAALAFQLLLRPEGLTETDLNPIQQRIRWPLSTPIMAVVGLAQAVTWPDFPEASVGFAVAASLVLHAILSLTRARRSSFIALTSAQAFFLTIGVIYFVRHTHLPSGG